ncbi:hypothetical protein BDP81DRAFT_92428 [Colletotrichum phormii]|uniref:Uncharacterized protein n=1 Tax=Colletotrichum phormii TaxID=359342 RepID=A0AAJ0EKW3_9PEZI|nr:uncharacterized protein BDP81DRAFT_92428 [Colletotrichum phormii]KAK1654992.1 hypothetical protein BDP81DRAFT_92428 [Colletotrichum phormii]
MGANGRKWEFSYRVMPACPRASETLPHPRRTRLRTRPSKSCRSARSGHSVRLVGFSSPPFRFGAPLISPHLLRPFISPQSRPSTPTHYQTPPGHPIRGNHHQIVRRLSRGNFHRASEIVSSFVFPFVAGLLISASSRVSLVSGSSSAPFSVRQMLLYNCVIP